LYLFVTTTAANLQETLARIVIALKRNGAYAGDIQVQQLGWAELFESECLVALAMLIEGSATGVKEIWLI
jgi:hypothetical protein